MADADRWLETARDLLANRQYLAAAEAARKAASRGAPRAECLRVAAEALLAAGRTREAQRTLAELAAAAPQDTWPLKRLAELHIAAGRPAKALALLQQAAAIDPQDAEAQQTLAQIAAVVAPMQASAPAPAMAAAAPRRPLALILAVVIALDLLVIGAVAAWLLLGRPGLKPQSAVAERAPTPASEPARPIQQATPPQQPATAVTRSTPSSRQGQPLAQANPPQQPTKPLTETQPPTQPTRPMAEAQPHNAPTKPLQEVTPRQKPRLKLLWVRCRPVPEMTVRAEGKIRRVYIMYGEVLNDSDVPCEVAIVRGRLLAHGQAAGYGLGELGQIPPHGKVRFSFYAYQLADERAPAPDNCDAIVIPGFGLSKMLEQLGLGPELEQLLRSGQAPEY